MTAAVDQSTLLGLRVRDLHVAYRTNRGLLRAVRGVDLDVASGERVGLVGESGSGKTTVVSALLGLLPPDARITGEARLGTDVLALDAAATSESWRPIRGRRLAAVPQGAMAGLHPAHRVDREVAEVISVHTGLERTEATDRARDLLHRVGLDDRAARSFPHELSGGMRQRVALAAALACSPEVLIADEPTVGLDAVTAARFLELLLERQATDGFGLLIVSHDLRTVRAACDRLAVAYAGRIVESATTGRLTASAVHPYAAGLLAAAPSLADGGWSAIPGTAPDLIEPPPGCAFAPRCPHRHDDCRSTAPTPVTVGDHRVECHLVNVAGAANGTHAAAPVTRFPTVERRPARTVGDAIVVVRDVSKTFRSRRLLTRIDTPALVDVDLDIRAGEIVGLVGSSGSGKSTLARSLLGLVVPDRGSIVVDGDEVVGARRRDLRRLRRRLALVHQDPYGSLHPAMSVVDLVAEPLAIDGVTRLERRRRALDALVLVGLDPSGDLGDRRAEQLSGGQRQRIALARALVAEPVVMVLDEPMSMLDASVRAGIAQTLLDIRDAVGVAIVVITHDLAEAAATCDRIVVLDKGRVVEQGTVADVLADRSHPATRLLFDLAADPTRSPNPPAEEPFDG